MYDNTRGLGYFQNAYTASMVAYAFALNDTKSQNASFAYSQLQRLVTRGKMIIVCVIIIYLGVRGLSKRLRITRSIKTKKIGRFSNLKCDD